MIARDPVNASKEEYDVIVVGGGIYGACTLLEAVQRGLRCLLLERDDFGGATSWNSLRILHGGLRYLQTLDFSRFRESVAERRWFCRNFPDLVEVLPCLMPLYGRGLKRASVLKSALALNDLLSRQRNAGVIDELHLPAGRILSAKETIDRIPNTQTAGLQGAALWYDARMVSPQRLLIEILRWACSLGARALNYCEAVGVLTDRNHVTGVEFQDRVTGDSHEVRGDVAINCAGPWSEQFATHMGAKSSLRFHPSLAFNVLLRKPPPIEAAVAAQAPDGQGQVYFVVPCRGMTLAGTVHRPYHDGYANGRPTPADINAFLDGLNRALPGQNLAEGDVCRVYSGMLPASRPGVQSLAKRATICDHRRCGGPAGLISVSGVKYTTARSTAERALHLANPRWYDAASHNPSRRSDGNSALPLVDPIDLIEGADDRWAAEINRMIREESVVYLDDLLFRRTDWAADPQRQICLRERIASLATCPLAEPQFA